MNKYRSPFVSIVFWVVIAAFFVGVVCSFGNMSQRDKNLLTNEDIQWFVEGDIPVDIEDSSQMSGFIKDNSYSVYFYAKEYDENIVLAFQTNFSTIEACINDLTFYSSKSNSHFVNGGIFPFEAPSSEIHLASVKKINEGDKITLRVKNAYDNVVCGVDNVYFGRSEDIVEAVFKNDLFGIVICIVLFAVAVLMFVFYFSFRKVISPYGLKYAALFALFSALHAISGGSTLPFLLVFGNNILYTIHCLCFTTMFLPLIMYFSENVHFRASITALHVAAVVHAALILGLSGLAVFNVIDLHESLPIAEIAGLIQCIFIFVILIYDFARKSEKRNSELIIPIVYAVCAVSAVIGHIINKTNSIPTLFAAGCLIFLVALLAENMRNVANLLRLSNEVEKMGKAAFTDALTGVGNTAAFNKKIKHLDVVKLNYKAIAIIQFDINNLKTINDNLGHEQGDKLITDGSGIIYKVFGKVGDVYRTGGDEFVGVICGDRAMALCDEAILSFERAIYEYNKDESHKFILQIAYGTEYYTNDGDNRYLTLKEIQKKADANMYENKRAMKERISVDQILKRVPINDDYME